MATEAPLPTTQLSAPDRRVIMSNIPVVESGLALGGPAHGHYIPIHGRRVGDLCQWRVPAMSVQSLSAAMFTAQRVCPYRLCRFSYGGREMLLWIPDNVPMGEEMLHVLKLALGGSVF